MVRNLLNFIFYGNYFVGLLALVLSVETCLQLRLPLPNPLYFISLFCATTFYYTYSYSSPKNVNMGNARTIWFLTHQTKVKWSQRILLTCCLFCTAIYSMVYATGIAALPFSYWLSIVILGLAALLYYGLLPTSGFKINLRNTGWLKAFVIGFVWAGTVSLLTVTVVKSESGSSLLYPVFGLWLFVKNWMFCTVNAIMFDIKDYAADSNKQLRTFVVRHGLRKTIFFVLIPLLCVGFLSILIFTHFMHFPAIPVLFNLLPFPLFLWAAWSLQKRHSLFYYLVVIDGIIMAKGLCGISGSFFM